MDSCTCSTLHAMKSNVYTSVGDFMLPCTSSNVSQAHARAKSFIINSSVTHTTASAHEKQLCRLCLDTYLNVRRSMAPRVSPLGQCCVPPHHPSSFVVECGSLHCLDQSFSEHLHVTSPIVPLL